MIREFAEKPDNWSELPEKLRHMAIVKIEFIQNDVPDVIMEVPRWHGEYTGPDSVSILNQERGLYIQGDHGWIYYPYFNIKSIEVQPKYKD